MRAKLFLAILCAAVTASACGGGGGGDVASLSNGSGDASASPTRALSRQDAALAWAQCMREHGVDMPDPQIDDKGGIILGGPPSGQMPSEETMRTADEACHDILGDPVGEDLSPGERAKLRDAGLEFAECMREEGFKIPDPGPDGSMSIPIGGSEGFDPEDPDFAAAQEKCRHFIDDAIGNSEPGVSDARS